MRNVPRMFDDLHDEIIATFKDEVPGYRDGNGKALMLSPCILVG